MKNKKGDFDVICGEERTIVLLQQENDHVVTMKYQTVGQVMIADNILKHLGFTKEQIEALKEASFFRKGKL